jgi:ribose/xylose/arabinose/galactoside ABC-type transport system permease subunit
MAKPTSDIEPAKRILPELDLSALGLFIARYAIVVAFLILLVWMSLASEHFLTSFNILNVLRQAAPILIVAIGMTFILATGGIDLSVGSVVALSSVLAAYLLADGFSAPVVIALVLIAGMFIGAINGFFVNQGVPAFIVTLAMLTLVRGVAFVYSDGYAKPVSDPLFLYLGRGRIGDIPVPVIIAVIVTVIGYFILTQTRLGRYMLAVGGREEAARVQGVPIHYIKMFVYSFTGFLAALAGIIITARLGNGSPNAGIMLELEVITAVVLGGTSLFGGSATMFGTVIGALFVSFIRNGLNLQGVSPFWVQVVTGAILLLGVYFNTRVTAKLTDLVRLARHRKEVS